jgi:hypothetical protein
MKANPNALRLTRAFGEGFADYVKQFNVRASLGDPSPLIDVIRMELKALSGLDLSAPSSRYSALHLSLYMHFNVIKRLWPKGAIMSQTHLFFVGGGKGGVGKSTAVVALIHYLSVKKRQKVAVIEADITNNDIGSLCNKAEISCQTRDLTGPDAYMEMMDFVSDHKGHCIVVNLPGIQKADELTPFFDFLTEAKEVMDNLRITTFFVVNPGQTSLTLFKTYKEACGFDVKVIKNKGSEAQFKPYDFGNVPQALMPLCGTRVFEPLFGSRPKTLQDVINTEPSVGLRAEARRWEKSLEAMWDKLDPLG